MTAPEAAHAVDLFWRFAFRIANKWSRSYPTHREAIESEVALLLWQAALSYPAGGPVTFMTHAGHTIRWGLIRWLKRERRQTPFKVQPLIVGHDGEAVDPAAVVAAPEEPDLAEIADDVEAVRQCVRPCDWESFYRHFADGATLEEIAVEVGVTRARIGQRIARAVRELRKAIGET